VPPEVTVDQIGDGSEPLRAHIHDPKAAHHATAIEINQPSPYYPYYTAQSVQGALDELGGLVPPLVPGVGKELDYIAISGIPDWGVLKLADSPLQSRDPSSFYITDNAPEQVYPYYWFPSQPAETRPPFDPPLWGGGDPITDPMFNVEDGVYDGGGTGKTFSGAWTPDVGGPNPIKQTMRLMELLGGDHYAIVSGVVCPADRGVLALLYWPPGGTMVDFLALPLEERVIAAILLGQGLEQQYDDGAPGGIFTIGETAGHYDPFAFPGQATGQYNLQELHTGVSITGTPFPFPADDTAGVVRIGNDPLAGLPIVPGGGLPVIGATTACLYGGNDNNFFQYRLPYFSDYSEGTGLRYTPDIEVERYFTPQPIMSGDLTTAGNYTNLEEDYWAFQLARFRHRFKMANSGASGDIREQGSYMLLHFKRELFFEDLVRDGIVPLDDRLYSANLVNWVDPENLDNITASWSDPAAPSYHVLRGAVTEDFSGLVNPLITGASWNYTRVADNSTYISGVAYFLPMQIGAAGNSFQISELTLGVTNFWKNTYRVKEEVGFRMRTMNPILLSVPAFSYSTNNLDFIKVPAGFLTDDTQQLREQRIEFQMEDLGAYTEANGPLPVDGATISLPPATTIDFAGDTEYPAFTENAKVRTFFRRPVAHDNVGGAEMPTSGGLLPVFGSKQILFHSTRFSDVDLPMYGNFLDGGGQSVASLETSQKDVQERFLDETYRWHSRWLGAPAPDISQLLGPGLPLGPAPIDLPVRTNLAFGGPFQPASWMLGLHNTGSLVSAVPTDLTTEAQVAGLPERNPPLTDGVIAPFPSSGICMYPQKDYSAGYRPSQVDGDITPAPQPNYGAASGIRDYVRAFDAGFSHGSPEPEVTGQPYFTLRVTGLKLEDFEYSGGPAQVAIYIKVPGLTTWMDAGRPDGEGPPKQDPAQDGAGCRVVGEGTFDQVDHPSGLVYCEVRVYVGPTIDLFTNSFGEVPVLVMVRFNDSFGARQMNFEQGSATGTVENLRGLVGLEIVRPVGV
jgi:hypothetical protein